MVERIAISLEKRLLDQFDKLIAAKGYSNRSEAVRDLIRDRLVEREWAAPAGETVATVLLVYEHDTMELSQKLVKLEHKQYRRIVAGLHIHMDPENCLEILVLRGPGKDDSAARRAADQPARRQARPFHPRHRRGADLTFLSYHQGAQTPRKDLRVKLLCRKHSFVTLRGCVGSFREGGNHVVRRILDSRFRGNDP